MKFRVGFIGLGIMGHRMLTGMSRHPDFELAWAWDLSPAAGAAVEKEYPGIRIASSAQELASQPLDLVYIATPPSTHLHYVRLSRTAVLCEKPLAVDLEDSRAIVREMKGKNAVNFPFASSPVVDALQKRLPAPRRVEIRFHFSEWPRTWQRGAASWLSRRPEGGFLREVFSHFAYLTIRLLGPVSIRSAQVDFPSDGVTSETFVMADLDAGGIPVHVCGGVGGAAPDYNEWTAYGADRSVRLFDWRRLAVSNGERWQEIEPDEPLLPDLGNQLNALSRMLRGEPHPLPNFAMGLDVQQLVESLIRNV